MADIKISALPTATNIADADTVAIVQGGVTKKLSASLLSLVSGWPVFVGSYSGTQAIGASAFNTISMSADVDSHSGWNGTLWTVPAGQGGTYEIAGKYRIADGYAGGANVSIGIGMHTSNVDHPAFFWDVTKPNRQGIQNVRVMALSAGEQVRLFAYIDGSAPNLSAASLTIQRIR